MHISNSERLYLLPKDGVHITNNWGGTGDLTVTGNTSVGGSVSAGSILTTQPKWNGWIAGNFGTDKDHRVVLGNLEEQATVGAHNKDLTAWTPLRLQGDSINMVPNNGNVNYPGGWRINCTSDGHFRIQHNGVDKLVVHKDALPVYAANGMDVGAWKGTGGGTLNVAGDTNIGGNIDINGRDRNNVPLKFGNFTLLGQADHVHFLKNGGAVSTAYCGGNPSWCPARTS
jgi:hypothetical protein